MFFDGPVDIVVPWVDSSDPVWRKEYEKYTAGTTSDNSEARYRDWDIFNYWFRGVDEYLPWVRKIHFVTFGHIPEWLDTKNPRINIVRHEDFIPEKYLPTFSSHTIELNMHRIPGLSEQFIYFNDDIYVTGPLEKTDFFRFGKPVDTPVLGVIKNDDLSNFMPYIMLNMMAIINTEFSQREVIFRNPFKWFTPKIGRDVLKNIYIAPWSTFTGFRNYHTGNPFLKSTFEAVWEKYGDILDETCSHKFRCKEDVNQYLMRYWQLCEGNFIPHRPNSDYVTIGNQPMEEVEDLLYDKDKKIICINDDPMGFDFEEERFKLGRILKEKYKHKSSFEI